MSNAVPEQDLELNSGACRVCGSARIMTNITVVDRNDNMMGDLEVSIARKPNALFFKERVNRVIRAMVCGECGHVELFVKDPQELYEAYLVSMASNVE